MKAQTAPQHTTNYFDTFIAVAPDSLAERGSAPPERALPSIALRTYQMIHAHPYQYTSDDVIFGIQADRQEIPSSERPAARREYFSKGRPCLRASDLGKKYGWGVHSDAEGRLALYGVETRAYQEYIDGARRASDGRAITVKHAMRSSR